MANLSTTNQNALYKYVAKITTTFNGTDGEPIVIDSLRIKSMIADYSYDSHSMPLIYATVALSYEQVNIFKDNIDQKTVILNIQKYIENSDMPGLKIDYVNQECIFYMNTDAGKDKEQALVPEEDRMPDYGYVLTLGLIAKDHVNKNKTTINGIVKNGTLSATVFYILRDHKLLMEPFSFNTQLKQVFIPPMKSVNSTLGYLNEISTFYETPYRFFMDFDCTYLMSSSGLALKKKGEEIISVSIKLFKEFDEANMEGMEEDKENKMYILNVSATNSSLMQNKVTKSTYSDIRGVNTTGDTASVELGKSPIIDKNTSSIRLSNENTQLIENMRTTALFNSTVISITKNRVDSSVFTLNKRYHINADDVYGTEFSGVYILSNKKEVYEQEGQNLTMGLLLTFKKVPDAVIMKEVNKKLSTMSDKEFEELIKQLYTVSPHDKVQGW